MTNIKVVPKTSNKGFAGIVALILVILVIGGGGAYYFFTQVQNLESTPKPTKEAQTTTQTEKNAVEDESESEAEVEVASLEAVGNYEGSGEATRVFENGKFTHTVGAALGEPAVGKFYEGWLVDKTPELTFFSTGRLSKDGRGYTLEFTADTNYEEYNEVVVTEETEANGLDGVPEDHVLEGAF